MRCRLRRVTPVAIRERYSSQESLPGGGQCRSAEAEAATDNSYFGNAPEAEFRCGAEKSTQV